MRVLFITPYVPSLIRVRPYNLIKGLAARGHAISLVTLVPGDEHRFVDEIRPHCQQVVAIPLPRGQIIANLWRGWWRQVPLQAAYGYSPTMQKQVTALIRRHSFDVVHVEHLRASLYGSEIHGLPKLYDSVDCISLLLERAIASGTQPQNRLVARLELGRTRRYEGRLAQTYDRILVTSQEDGKALLDLIARHDHAPRSDHVIVLPNGVDLAYFEPLDLPRRPHTLIFSGKMSYHANVASALYLAREIMPLIWREQPHTELWIVGKDPPPAVRKLGHDARITITGYVPDMRPYLAQATIAATPVRYGVGIQNKVLEAMALGTPVVTSPRACAALRAVPDEHLLVGETAAAFAEKVLQLIDDPALAQRIGMRGRDYVQAHHDWQTIAAALEGTYRQTIDGP